MEENKYKIIYLPIAYDDLIEITENLLDNSFNEIETLKYINGLEKKISSLKRFPFRGKTYNLGKKRKEQYRIIIYKNYMIFYVIQNNFVEIRRILHEKRNIKKII